ncbi:structure-specific endonuclease subunit SLX4 isoform X2 [Monodelphis domestica]|uniref:structure-specific endonuclease subunit SLX4 isoform X2 n=1 Tax=Monodelphis domestica TaxID=13616 RepID=UPI0004432EE8|nr:structure-specific endonuclease subunit SLX4 isoform X2 [Monodelphis domestica]XP_056661790.1 structure-specific endonuclease subunit SLX4 isoform X2 [Monodelphis domestica]XP_056661791.1 structure-specific endonuclease subunit SLX4 isoform X2 [Monodelphis domestica]
MDESDDDFNELCSKLLRRVRKKGVKEGPGETRTQEEASSFQTKSKLKRTKLPPKTKISHVTTGKKTKLGGLAPGNEGKCEVEVTSHESKVAPSSEREEDLLAPTQKGPMPQLSQLKNQTGVPDDSSQIASCCLSTLLPSVPKPRAAELVLQKMQQFKRTSPEKLKHNSESCSVETILKENVPKSSQEEDTLNNGNVPRLSVMESDAALALVLQQEFVQETPQNADSLEQEGLFFCQICQKDLSAMNATRREQHVNRCLDESEKSLESISVAPKIPECPICGKPFTTLKSRNSHLKQCAVKMEVSPQQLVQAVRLQTFQPDECFPSASSTPAGRSKRKGSTNEKKPQKRRKTTKTETMSEDLLVAMAMSHSLMEQSKTVTNDNLGNVFSNNIKPGSEKKNWKKKLISPPQLLVQDSETYLQQIQDRIAILLTEELVLSSTAPLPLSRILKEEMGKAHWCLPQPEEKQGILWKGSSLTEIWPLESFYATGLSPYILPWKPMKTSENEPILPLMAVSQSKPDVQQLPVSSDPPSEDFYSTVPEELNSRRQSLSCSQKDQQTLQVLMDLAGEGMTLTQWNSNAETLSRSSPGKDLGPCDLPLTGFVLSPKRKKYQRSRNSPLSLGLLSADFGTMVNNPHLSDVQFQMDSGDVLYAHMFVLYARCPCLIQTVYSEGFFVVEDGNLRTRRVLLNDVSTETAHMFLHYLYTADINIPSHLLMDLHSLAVRFGIKELVDLCESGLEITDFNSVDDMFLVEREEKDCESRAENFQELLRSMWVDEDKESGPLLKLEDQEEDDREKVNEEEMEEIYEFAATQRKMLQGKCQTKEDPVAGQPGEEITIFECLPGGIKFEKLIDNTDKTDSSEQVKGQDPTRRCNLNIKHFTPVAFQEKIPDDKSGTESPEKDCSPKPTKADAHSSTSDLLGEGTGESLREKLSSLNSLHDFDLDKSYDQLFSVTREYCEPFQINCSPEKQKETFPRKEVSNSPILCRTPPLQPNFSPSHNHYQSPSNSQIFPQYRQGSSPLSPQLKRNFSKIVCPILAEKQKKNNDEDLVCINNSECGYIGSHKNIAVPISTIKSPSIDLTKPKSCQRLSQLNIRSQHFLSQANTDDDVILLLDSDEEMEIEKTKIKPVFDSPLGERKMPRTSISKGKEMKNSPKATKSFLMIDIDSDQRYSQKPEAIEVGVHKDIVTTVLTEAQSNRKGNGYLNDELDVKLVSKHDSSKEESSSTDTSWLVPATPLTNKSHDSLSQMRVTSIFSRPSSLKEKVLQCKTKVLIEDKDANEINKVTINVPQISHMLPISSENKSLPDTPGSERSSYRSPAIRYSKVNKNLSTIVPIQLSHECPDLTKQSLESPSSHSRLSSAEEQPVLIQNVCSEVVEVEDSEEELDRDPCPLSSSLLLNSDPPIPVDDDCWNIEPLSPIPIDDVNLERTGHLSTSSPNNKVCETLNNRERNSPGTPSRMDSIPVCGSPLDKRRSLQCNEKKSLGTGSPGNSKLSYLNSALWDDWDGDEQKSADILPLAERLSNEEATQELEVLKTPKASAQKINRPPKVPITPMPSYSIMETPELKKELDRFGVRPLPKRQMVLKLKEIFQYTHQILPSDSEDEIQALQTSPRMMAEPCRLPQTTSQVKTSGAVTELPPAPSSSTLPSVEVAESESLSSTRRQKLKNLAKTQGRRKQPHKSLVTLTQPAAEDVDLGPAGDNQLSLSQKSLESSTDESENSFGSQSSLASEFETVFESEGEEEEEITASQAAVQEADKEEAVRRYIRSHPALYQKVLLYQPFELADFQAELRQNGIKFAMGKLLDFMDAHCITFTTAGARKEKLKKKKLQPGGKKRGKHY